MDGNEAKLQLTRKILNDINSIGIQQTTKIQHIFQFDYALFRADTVPLESFIYSIFI